MLTRIFRTRKKRHRPSISHTIFHIHFGSYDADPFCRSISSRFSRFLAQVSVKPCDVVLSNVVAGVHTNAAVPRTPETDNSAWSKSSLKLGFVLSKLVRLFSNSQFRRTKSGWS